MAGTRVTVTVLMHPCILNIICILTYRSNKTIDKHLATLHAQYYCSCPVGTVSVANTGVERNMYICFVYLSLQSSLLSTYSVFALMEVDWTDCENRAEKN